jgi:hypothetical protein
MTESSVMKRYLLQYYDISAARYMKKVKVPVQNST